MAAGEQVTVVWIERESGQERLKETSEVITDTRFPNEDVYLYERETNRAIVEEEKTIYEYIYVYVKVGKNKYFNQRNIPLLVLKMYF